MPNFLFEILVEEIPHGVLPGTSQYLKTQIPALLSKYALSSESIEYFISPRRLAFLIKGLPTKGQDRILEQKGPSLKAAYDENGNPTKALEGFFNSYKVTKNDIEEREIKGQSYIFIQKNEEGASLPDILPMILGELIKGISFPQPMRWNHKDEVHEFIRPVRGIVALIDKEILPVKFFGIEADRTLKAHRQLAPNPISLDHADNYKEVLKKNACIASFEERENFIKSEIEKLVKSINGVALLDDELLSILASLTEFPHPLLATFDSSFLSLPKEVLISEMKVHQKYVPIMDDKGNLLPNYIITANISYEDAETKANILKGNNRVLKARFADGQFFYEEDHKKGLDFYSDSLKSIAFVEGAGSIADKIERIQKIALYLKKLLSLDIKEDSLKKAIQYAKADLSSLMVGEFPELQGIIGSYYAQSQGLSEDVATAIREHYYPMNLEGENLHPSIPLSGLVGLADRIDNLLTLYAVGKTVTGSRDPYALRRQTIAIINILTQFQWTKFSINDMFENLSDIYKPILSVSKEDWKQSLEMFIKVRLEGILKVAPYEYSADTLNATLISIDFILDDIKKAGALQRVREEHAEQFQHLIELAKRISNILKNQSISSIKEELLSEKEEKDLYKAYRDLSEKIENLSYDERLQELVNMEKIITSFFDNIMVKTGDAKEINRIALLSLIHQLFIKQADFSKLS